MLPRGQKPELLILMAVCLQDGLALSIPELSYTKISVTGNVATRWVHMQLHNNRMDNNASLPQSQLEANQK
jgi:hypothetical protein